MLQHSLAKLTSHLMWTSILIFLLTLEIVATPSRDATNCFTIRNGDKEVRLSECESGVFFRAFENESELYCHHKPAYAEYSRQDVAFDCTGVKSLKEFKVNDEQYLLTTDIDRGQVKLLALDEDTGSFFTKQILPVDSPFSAEVVPHRGQLLLLVAVYDGQGCSRCDNLLSPVYRWDHVVGSFNEAPIQYLPSSKDIHWFPDRHNDESTVFLVIPRCDCSTLLYSWDRGTSLFQVIPQGKFERVPKKSDITIQTFRHHKTQYVLLAQLREDTPKKRRSSKKHGIRIFQWLPHRGMVLEGHLEIIVNAFAQRGLSVIQYKDQVFMCTITTGTNLRGLTTISKLQLQSDGGSSPATASEVGRTEDPHHTQSSCMLFVHPQDLELYAAVGYWNGPTSLLRYSTITDSFSYAGELSQATNTRDLVTFQKGDDFFIAAVGEDSPCKLYKS